MATNCSFKGVPFEVVDSMEDIGNNLVIHEYPNRSTPYIENIRRKTHTYRLKAFIAGNGFETTRNKLMDVCQDGKKGILSHPAYGDIEVYCENISVNNFYINNIGKCELDLTFVESGKNANPTAFINTRSKLLATATQNITALQTAFNTFYKITALPQVAIDYATNYFQKLTGLTPFQVLGVIDSAKALMSTNFIDSVAFGSNISNYLQSFRSSSDNYFNDNPNENFNNSKHPLGGDLTPFISIDSLQDIIDFSYNFVNNFPVSETTANKRHLKVLSEAVIRLVVCNATLEQAAISTYLSYDSLGDAEGIWSKIDTNFDKAIDYCALKGDDKSYLAMRDSKAAFLADIKARAPDLSQTLTLTQLEPIPSLVLAWELYADISREQEIIKRNNIVNPLFVSGHAITVLEE